MKLAKKILVAMLALALLTSAFLFSATATDTFNAPGIDDIEDIYEYYTLDDYLADNYEDGTWTTGLFTKNLGKVEQDPTDSTNKVLNVELGKGKKGGYEMVATKKADGLTDQLFLTFKIYFDQSAAGYLCYELKVGTVNDKGVATSSQFTILQINFADQKGDTGFYCSTWDATSQSFNPDLTKIEGVTPEVGKWYDVVISVNAAEDFYSFDIKDDQGVSVVSSGNCSLEGAKALWGFNCGGQSFNKTSGSITEYYLDDMEIYEGSFVRYPTRINEITTIHLKDLKALYEASADDYDTQYRIASVLDYLYNEAEGFEVADVLPEAYKYINETFAKAFNNVVAGIDTTLGYYERLEYANSIADYDAKIPTPETLTGAPGITADLEAAIVASRAAYAAEVAALNDIKAQSDAFVALMGAYANDNKDYTYVTEYFAEASTDKYTKRDASYEGVAAAEEIYAALEFKANRMEDDINAFVAAVEKMEAATTFGPLFVAYVEANASYTKYGTDALINPDLDNSTKEGLADKITSYESKVETILATAFVCDEFNRIINEATISSYYTSLVGEIKEAAVVREQFGDYEMDYPGLAESVAAYEAFVAAIAESESAVEAYITAVNAIATKTTFAEKKAAITAALALKAEGDVLGVEGVVEANIALTTAEAEINFLEGSSTTLISLVEQIKAAKTLAEKRTLIHLANVSAVNAEDTYTGVSAAKADLAAEIEAFNAAVAAANGALESAINNAQAIVSSVGGAKIFVAGN